METISANIDADCILRVRPDVHGKGFRQAYTVTLALAYPATERTYDELWSIAQRSDADRYFPIVSSLHELTDFPSQGLPASDPNAIDSLAQHVSAAIRTCISPMRTQASARAELERGRNSPWFSRIAYESWLPVVLLLEEGPSSGYRFACKVLEEMGPEESPRTIAYRQFVSNLRRRAETDA